MNCPCCEQPLPQRTGLKLVPRYNIVMTSEHAVVLSPHAFKILEAVMRCARPIDDLIDVLYSERRDGGPDTARECVITSVTRINKAINPMGWAVRNHSRGMGTHLYRLEHVARPSA